LEIFSIWKTFGLHMELNSNIRGFRKGEAMHVDHPTIPQIIEAAGGPKGIADASNGDVNAWAPYKWKTNGIPQKHFDLIARLANVSIEHIHRANQNLEVSDAFETGAAA
jgi:hypothetical protein